VSTMSLLFRVFITEVVVIVVVVVVMVVLFFFKEMNARARVRFVFVWAKFLLSSRITRYGRRPKRKTHKRSKRIFLFLSVVFDFFFLAYS